MEERGQISTSFILFIILFLMGLGAITFLVFYNFETNKEVYQTENQSILNNSEKSIADSGNSLTQVQGSSTEQNLNVHTNPSSSGGSGGAPSSSQVAQEIPATSVITCEQGYSYYQGQCLKVVKQEEVYNLIQASNLSYVQEESMDFVVSRPSASYGPNFNGNILKDEEDNMYLIGTFTENLTIGKNVYQSSQRKNENLTITNNLANIINEGLGNLPGMLIIYGADGIIAKKNSQGNWDWVKTIETRTFIASEGGKLYPLPASSGIDILFSDQDSEGNIYIGGFFSGQIKFNSVLNLTSYIYYSQYCGGYSDCVYFSNPSPFLREPFIAKISSNGEWQWAKKLSNKDYLPSLNPEYKMAYPSRNRGVVTLKNMKIINDKIIFNGEAVDSIYLDNVILLKNYTYNYIGEIDFLGNLKSAKEIKNSDIKSNFGGLTSQIDNLGNLYLIDENVSKFDLNGTLVWVQQLDKKVYWLDSALKSYLGSSALDEEGNLYLVGKYREDISLFGILLFKHPRSLANTNESGFVAKVYKNGSLSWIKSFYHKEVILNMKVSDNKVYLVGGRTTYKDVNDGNYSYFGTFSLSNYNGYIPLGSQEVKGDIFLVEINSSNGNFLSTGILEDTNSNSIKSFFIKDNDIYLLGIGVESYASFTYDAPLKLFIWKISQINFSPESKSWFDIIKRFFNFN